MLFASSVRRRLRVGLFVERRKSARTSRHNPKQTPHQPALTLCSALLCSPPHTAPQCCTLSSREGERGVATLSLSLPADRSNSNRPLASLCSAAASHVAPIHDCELKQSASLDILSNHERSDVDSKAKHRCCSIADVATAFAASPPSAAPHPPSPLLLLPFAASHDSSPLLCCSHRRCQVIGEHSPFFNAATPAAVQ